MSLYRKYRPQTFEDVVGQDHVARTLRNALTARPPRVAHAYLFTGPRGIGKTTNARLMAKCLNCETGPTATPCNKCDFCVRVTTNQPVMDMLEIDAASHTGVDNIRETIIEKVNVAPAQGRYRIYIIDEVHMLSTSSFNALLKTLEEPPAHAVFILATTDAHKVPQTILSRCQRFDFRRVGLPDIVGRLHHVAKGEGLKLQEEAARLIARHAEGALRDALTLLEQVSAYAADEITAADVRLVLGGVPEELIYELVSSVAAGDARGVLGAMEKAVDEGASFSQLGKDLTAYCRDLLLLTVGYALAEATPEETIIRQRHAQEMGCARLETLITAMREAEKEMRNSTDHRLLLELTLVRATGGNYAAATTPAPLPAPGSRPTLVTAPPAPVKPVEAPVTPIRRVEGPPAPVVEVVEVAEEVEIAATIVEERPLRPKIDPELERMALSAPPEEEEAGQVSAAVIQEAAPPVEPESGSSEPAERKSGRKGRRISNFDEMQELWPQLLMRIRKKIGVTAVAYLHDARPAGFTDDDVILEFHKEFHYAKATEASGRLPFESTINEVLDRPRRLRFQLIPPSAPAVAPGPDPDPNPSGDDDDWEEDIVEYTQRMFGAEIMGRSG